MRTLLLGCLLPGALCAQTIVSESRLSAGLRSFESRPNEPVLHCEVTPIRPMLNFSFRFQSGYVFRVPMDQYEGAGHGWAVLAKVTPEGEGAKPVYLLSRIRLPNVPKTKTQVDLGGGYLLGEGRYHVLWKLMDDQGRTCRSSWTTEAKRTSHERQVKMAIEPATVAEFSLRGVTSLRHDPDDVAPIRLTVLLNAAPVSPRRTVMRASDQVMLIGTLSSLLERVPTSSVRLVVFNLDQQKELLRKDDFRLENVNQVSEAIRGLQLSLVDYHVLQNRGGHVDLLADLVNQEVRAEKPSDVVLFLGPTTRFTDKVPNDVLERPQSGAPRFFYFEYKPFLRQMQASIPDSIHGLVGRLRGKSVVIRSPGEFAKAIDDMERRAASK